jgi:arabinofuranan 3-O-arabinosyltransferase
MRRVWIALAAVTLAVLLLDFYRGDWLITAAGDPQLRDFLSLWAASVRAWEGGAALAYDAEAHRQFQTALSGVTVRHLPFPYPPHFLFMVLPFASLPYVPATITFLALTAAAYAAVLRLITKDWLAMALAFGGSYMALFYCQIGFLTAALLVGGLALMPSRPIAAGALFGLLTVKPHMGVALALALLLGREWKAIGAALATTAAMLVAATVVFGAGIWSAYLPAIQGQAAWLILGPAWVKASSVYASLYPFAGPQGAMIAHLASAVLAPILMALLWMRGAPYNVRAAAVIAATLLVSPYLYPYDAVALTGAAAFLLKDEAPTPEKALIVLACVLPGLSFLIHGAAVPIAAWLMLYVAWRRAPT